MSDYSKTTNFTAKDSLSSGDPNKLVKGVDIDTEFDNIATASATKANKIASPTNGNVVEMDANGDIVNSGVASNNVALLTGNNIFTGEVSMRNYYVTDGGAADAYTATPASAWGAYAAKYKITVKIANTNTGASTLNVSALGAQAIKLLDGSALYAGALQAGGIYEFVYDGTNFIVLNPDAMAYAYGISQNTSGFPDISGLDPLAIYSPSAASSVDITSVIDGTYDWYTVAFMLHCSAAATISARLSTDNGTSWKSGASDYYENLTAYSYMNLSNTAVWNNAAALISGVTSFRGLYDATYRTFYQNQSNWPASSTQSLAYSQEGMRAAAEADNAIQIYPSTGTFTGTVRIYGMRT